MASSRRASGGVGGVGYSRLCSQVCSSARRSTCGCSGSCRCYTRPAFLKSEIAQGRVIVGATPQRPVILTFVLFDWQVIDAGDTQVHQPVLVELPVLVAIAAEPIAAIVVPFVSEANRDSVLVECPNLLD